MLYFKTSISTFVSSLLNVQKRKTNFWPERHLILAYKKGSMRPGCVVKQLEKIKPIIMGLLDFPCCQLITKFRLGLVVYVFVMFQNSVKCFQQL